MDYSNPDYLYSRCSICFDMTLDFYLRKCRDQFCETCFSTYVQDIIQSSWGLQIACIKCPVCADPIPYSEWTDYVDDELVQLYNKMNKPFKVMNRSCSVCHHTLNALPDPIAASQYHSCHEYRRSIEDSESDVSDSDDNNSMASSSSTPSSVSSPRNMTAMTLPSSPTCSVTLKTKFEAIHDDIGHLLTMDGRTLTYYAKTTLDIFERNYLNHLEGGYMSLMFIYKALMSDLGAVLNFKLDKQGRLMNVTEKQHVPGKTGADNNGKTVSQTASMDELTKKASVMVCNRTSTPKSTVTAQLLLPNMLSKSEYTLLKRISEQVISLESKPECWMQMQFMHVHNFPKCTCKECGEDACFQCGAHPYHDQATCRSHMYALLDQQVAQSGNGMGLSTEERLSLEWSLQNSKQCPQCSIHIYREEGCHKVDCVYCGFQFCWICLKAFESGKCGFYQCVNAHAAYEQSMAESEMDGDEPYSMDSAARKKKSRSDSATFEDRHPSMTSANSMATLHMEATESDAVTERMSAKTVAMPSMNAQPERGVPNVQKIYRFK